MEKERMAICDMILQIINGDQLSAEEENKIKMLLQERERKRESARMSRCLAGIIEAEMQRKVDEGIIKQSTKGRYQPLIKRNFVETEFGNLDGSQISSEIAVDEFVLETYDSCTLCDAEMQQFLRLLRMGLKKMSEEKILGFKMEKGMFRYHILNSHGNGIRTIRNPYPMQEVEKIMGWVDRNQDDIRGLAVGFWLLGGISPLQIINIRLEDYNDDKKLDINNIEFSECIRKKRETILERAIALHLEDGGYLFMVYKNKEWHKLDDKSLQIKLYYICKSIGIRYKSFHKNEVIIPDEQRNQQ